MARAKKQLGSSVAWLSDNMSNELSQALGQRSNSEFVLSPDGEILALRDWSSPEKLRKDLAAIFDRPTVRIQ